MRQPTFFIPHGGGPCFFLDPANGVPPMWQGMADFLSSILPSLPERPKALLIISGHWEEPRFTVHDGAQPGLLYDYSGFPPHTYKLRWDAPGAPDIAHRAAALLESAGVPTSTDASRGWDHGVFIPMMVTDPEADIPTAQLSLRAGFDAAEHLAVGKALAPLRDEGVLIIGSGMSFHNMGMRGPGATPGAVIFDEALVAAVTDPDPARRTASLARWDALPQARFAHPREEHLIPLMVAAGAGADDPATHVYRDQVIGWQVSAFRFG